jgi:hypothetical protein
MYKYKPSIYSEIETQDHIFQCKSCPECEKLQNDYKLRLGIIQENHHTNPACMLMIKHQVSNYLEKKNSLGIDTLVPNATTVLKKAANEQKLIGWDQWIKGRITTTWGTFQNYNIRTKDFGIKFDSAKKWVEELILLSWEFTCKCWLTRNVSSTTQMEILKQGEKKN